MILLDEKPTVPGLASYTYGETIDEGGIDAIVEAVNYGFATAGAKHNIGTWEYLWTTSTTWTQEAASSSSDDLNDYNFAIQPARAEIGGLDPSGSTSAYVLVFEFYASALDLRISLDGLRHRQAPGSSVAQDIVSFGEKPSWERVVFVVDDGDCAAFKVKLEFLWNESESSTRGDLYAGTLEEIRYVNLAHAKTPSLVTYGSEYIAPLPTGEYVQEIESEGAQYTLSQPGQLSRWPIMVRGALTTGVHALDFDGQRSMGTDDVNFDGLDGITFSALVYQANNTNSFMPWSKQTSGGGQQWYDYWAGSSVGPRGVDMRDSSTGNTGAYSCTTSRPPAGQWVDYTWTWSASRGVIEIYFDGVLQQSNSTGSFDELVCTPGTLWWGAYYTGTSFNWQGLMAMPCVIGGDLPLRDLERLMHWRRSVHGIG